MADKKQFETVSDGLLVRAPAKINLSLLIAGKRPDGFHEIETIISKVNFYDEILIQPRSENGIELHCEGPHWAPDGEENLVYRAAQMILQNCHLQSGFKITLTKNIPAGTGLGSASSDAAATLLGLNRLLELKLSDETLGEMACELGSDVSFFLGGPLAICTGKGEKIEKLEKNFNFLALLVLSDVTVPTKTVYDDYRDNKTLYETLNRQINTCIRENKFALVPKMCANMLQVSCFGLHKELAELKGKIESLGIKPLCLSGSGSAMFHIMSIGDEKIAVQYQQIIESETGCKSIIVSNGRW
ncbi:MAG: 4-(cytidine 5'-diphospho)-2-C-methyl-D-erythritol kinase [Planctomycetes bacterium]|nr:4-(cytidine 5'-diphospho)-2-C-methyl-D-erythritol kinase [Planctomycetota bacterium]